MARSDLVICRRESSACLVISHTHTYCGPVFDLRGHLTSLQESYTNPSTQLLYPVIFLELLNYSKFHFTVIALCVSGRNYRKRFIYRVKKWYHLRHRNTFVDNQPFKQESSQSCILYIDQLAYWVVGSFNPKW